MKNLLKVFFVFLFVAVSLTYCQKKDLKLATVSILKTEPVIDGVIDEKEWQAAVSTYGFQYIDWKQLLEPRIGKSYFGISKNKMFFAVVSELPPDGKLVSNFKNRDSDIIYDDGVEIWLDVNPDEQGKMKKVFQSIFNSAGGIFDVKFETGKVPDTGWNGNWNVASKIDTENKVWILEISLPLGDLGIDNVDSIKSVGVLIARNFKRPGSQVTWFPHLGAFEAIGEYPKIFITKDEPSVQILDFGKEFFEGLPVIKAKVYNPAGVEKKVKVNLEINSTYMPTLNDEKIMDIPSGGQNFYEFAVPKDLIKPQAESSMKIVVQSEDGKQIYMSYWCKWTRFNREKWSIRIGPDYEKAVVLKYYPSYSMISLKLDPNYLGEEEGKKLKTAEIMVNSKDGKKILSEKFSWEKSPFERIIDVGQLNDGEYESIIKFTGYDYEFKRKFYRQHFLWENNKLGITEEIYEPFKPIKKNQNEIEVVMRKYNQVGLGFWSSIKASDNRTPEKFEEILDSPIKLLLDGKEVKGKGNFVLTNKNKAIYAGQSTSSPVEIKTLCTTEYDGCMKVEMEILPGNKEIKSLVLQIPLKKEIASLMHVCTTNLRANPAGAIPEGTGVVWDSTRFMDGNWHGNFKPYIWIGNEEKGICWFADNDSGWVLDFEKNSPCFTIEREKNSVILKAHFVQKPIVIDKPRKIVFGLMASPAKPMRKDWRKFLFITRYKDYPRISFMGAEYWGSDAPFCSKYPINKDFSVLDTIKDLRLKKKVDINKFLQEYEERNFKPGVQLLQRTKQEIMNVVKVSFNWAQGSSNPYDYTSAYWEEFVAVNPLHEEVKTFKNEWEAGIVPSYIDFAVWYAKEFIERGIGLYFDNTFPIKSYDTLITPAYKLPDGSIQPSAGIWARREYLKRIWVLHRTVADPQLPVIHFLHTTNTLILPYMVWADANLDLEWFYGPKPAQTKYSPELLRTESIARQVGNIPVALARTSPPPAKTKEEAILAERTRFGVLMVHEVKFEGSETLMKKLLDFGYGQNDCEVYNYWEKDFPVKISDEKNVKALLLKKDKSLLLLLCTWNSEPDTVVLNLNLKKLNISPEVAIDVENENERYPLVNGSIKIPLQGYGVKLLRM